VHAAGDAIAAALSGLAGMNPSELRDHRAQKFEAIGRTLG
jgi:acetyl-CoA carboxylase carboxyl transferase subunit alpha